MIIKVLLTTIFYFCAVFFPLAVAEEGDFNELKKINASDGINQQEAFVIAKAFFLSEISGCGFPDEPVKQSGFWVIQTHIGLAGLSGEPIYVDINNGAITWKGDKGVVKMTLKELKNIIQK